jgi:hypothetical protein
MSAARKIALSASTSLHRGVFFMLKAGPVFPHNQDKGARSIKIPEPSGSSKAP